MDPGWSLRAALLVMGGGAAGSLARWSLQLLLNRAAFPWGTLAVNAVGSFLIALLLFSSAGRDAFSADTRLLLATGVLGGFTTMSAFALETTTFLDEGHATRAILYVGATLLCTLGGALAGRALAAWT